jgi:Heterokaryon incompatibility protein (HET)
MPYIARALSDPGCFGLITSWLTECRAGHPNCRSNTDVSLPTRVIDVGHNGASPRLLLTEGRRGEYLTLSYCWGSTKQITTTLANLSDRLNALPLDSLPRTHREAIEITHRLGFQYLWIDAVCIVQDDPADWNRESAKMFNIYRDSVLTIAASCARDVSLLRDPRVCLPIQPFPLAFDTQTRQIRP